MLSESGSTDRSPGDERLDRRTVAVVAVMAAAAFMAVLDGTIVTVAIDSFTTTFDASVATIGSGSAGGAPCAPATARTRGTPAPGWSPPRAPPADRRPPRR